MKSYIFLLSILYFLNLKSSLNAQNAPLEIAEKVTIQSKVLNESRELLIYKPKTASKKTVKYPVIYIFDGESLFLPTIGAVNFMSYSSEIPQIPEAIVVGIVNKDRMRDMPVPQRFEKVDGAAMFLQYLEKEVITYINQNYTTNGLNVLIGHSQGGTFVTYAAAERPKLFPFVLALDAPMTINPTLANAFLEKISPACKMRYVSAETVFGWRDLWKMEGACFSATQLAVENETHESMPYKSIYDGLKILFKDYVLTEKDLSLTKMEAYFSSLTEKYNAELPIPPSPLLGSASRKIAQSRKKEAIELITYYEKLYGQNERTLNLLAQSNAITKEPDPRVDYYLNLPDPSAATIAPFLGKWKGIVEVPGGQNMNVQFEIKKENGKYILAGETGPEGAKWKTQNDILHVTEKGELIWGRKGSGGVYVSIGKINKNGLLEGKEDLIGVSPPPGFGPFVPNTFEFERIQ